MINFDNVTKVLGDNTVLDGMDLHINKGETFVLVGPSGTGKSVTLKHIVSLMTPDSGTVTVMGEDLSVCSKKRKAEILSNFGYLFQGGALLAWMSVADNVALPLVEKTNMKKKDIYEKVYNALKMVGLEDDGDKMPSSISGGMKKRAGLARAIIRDPQIILYDEPTSGLDPVMARTIDNLIIDLNKKKNGMTSLVVTHDLHSALSVADRIGLLYSGKVIVDLPPEDFIKSENAEVVKFLEAQYITKRGLWEKERK
jgi:phospholipid/cholesterol/gamma-HCH transport system ATP-binding protein